jgi:O-antigen/teichoic acid export membrane protein
MSLLRSQRFRNFAKNSGMLFLSNKLQAVLLLGQSVIVARSLGVSRYGQWAVVTAFCTLIADFLGFRTGDVLSRYVVILRKKGNISLLEKLFQRAFILDFLTDTAGLAVILLLSPLVSRRFNGPGDAWIYLIYALSLVLGFVASCWFSLERDRGNFRFISLLSFFRTLSNLLLICFFFLIWKKTGFRYLALAYMLSESMIFCVRLVRIDRMLKNFYESSLVRVLWKRCRPEELQAVENREFWQFMRINYFSSSISSLVKKIDVLAAGFFFSATDVGLLKMGKSLAGIIQDVSREMGKPIYQDFTELIAAGELKKVHQFLKKYLIYYLAAVFTALVILSIFAGPFISFAYGPKYLPATTFFRLYLFLVFLVLGFFWMDPLIVSMGRYKKKLTVQLIAFILYFPVLYLGVKIMGISGIIVAYLFFVAFNFVLMGIYLRE